MDKHAVWKWLILVGLVSFSLCVVSPPFDRRDATGRVVVAGKLRLGLDLKGGTSFTVKIDETRAREEIRERSPELTDEQVDKETARALEGAQERALEVLRNRVDRLGIAEPSLTAGRDNRIIIQLPGIDEQKRREAEESIRSVAFLEFRMVHEKNDDLVRRLFDEDLAPEGYRIDAARGVSVYRRDTAAVRDEAMDEAFRARLGRFQVPDAGYEFMLMKQDSDGAETYRPYFVKKVRELSGQYLKSAAVDYQSLGQPVVRLQFDSKGARKFANITADYAPGGAKNPDPDKARFLAIVLDGTLYSAPYLKEPIYGGRAEISGSFSLREAAFLRNILNSGSLPAPVKVVERRIVDPSLGSDSIRSGVNAGIWGCAAIVALMALYYLIPGLIADMALLLNVILLPLGMILVAGFLGIFSGGSHSGGPMALPVLTLPGIAGIALTISMAVDANVLIFERIREELRQSRGFAAAIRAGYERAFTAILDSNVTTIITAIILFMLGSGPVRGYAVTLTGGLLVSLYTSVVVTRMCFNAVAARSQKPMLLRMLSFFPATKIDFVGKWKAAAAISAVVILGSWGVMTARGVKDPASVFGVDFVGGSAVTLALDGPGEAPGVVALRETLDGAGLRDATIQYLSEKEGGRQSLLVKTSGEGGLIGQSLAEKFPEAGFRVMQQDDVGPQIGSELKRKAGWAMLWSLVAMVAYISWRFEFGFALGAVVALFHDVLVTAGLTHLLGFQMSMTVVAALMTIVGYSVNDTIVIFDRIREDLRLVRGKTFTEICNQSMNETLSRTLLTNALTMICVLSLVVFGGGAIKDFSVAMLIGMITGTYSTVYVATPVVLRWYGSRTPELAPAVKAK
ncbi:MAG: protein translocase subunit SecD [Lentisphaerae bacterium]|nr:protein translocase subunit SecD [Lentisphaerota bacterium]